MDHFPSMAWGRPRNDFGGDPYASLPTYQPAPLATYGEKVSQDRFSDSVQHTQQPIVTGTSVIGIKFKDGIMLAADTLASYGSLARFKDIRRMHAVGKHTVVGASGDMADFQQMQKFLDSLMTDEEIAEDGHVLTTSQIYEYMSNLMYQKRSKIDPLWNAFIVGGLDKQGKKPYLGYVDLLGTTYQAPCIATGFGAYLAVPLMRKALDSLGENGEEKLDEKDARKVIEQCMQVLFYRDARSLNKFQIATVKADGVSIDEPMSAPTSWDFAESLRGYGNSDETY